eukprot:7391580-Prymnesium_polylepis.1
MATFACRRARASAGSVVCAPHDIETHERRDVVLRHVGSWQRRFLECSLGYCGRCTNRILGDNALQANDSNLRCSQYARLSSSGTLRSGLKGGLLASSMACSVASLTWGP